MRFFTPELYEQYATATSKDAAKVEAKWDAAEARYERRLKQIRSAMPAGIRELADDLCLHDAMLVEALLASGELELRLTKDGVRIVLRYHLVQEAREKRLKASKLPFEPLPRWLYDEVDMLRKGTFTHDILLSDGRTMTLTFDDCAIHEIHPLGTTMRLQAVGACSASAEATVPEVVTPRPRKRANDAVTKAPKVVRITENRRNAGGPPRSGARTSTVADISAPAKLVHTRRYATKSTKKSRTKSTS